MTLAFGGTKYASEGTGKSNFPSASQPWVLTMNEPLPFLVRQIILSYLSYDDQVKLQNLSSYFQVVDQNQADRLQEWFQYWNKIQTNFEIFNMITTLRIQTINHPYSFDEYFSNTRKAEKYTYINYASDLVPYGYDPQSLTETVELTPIGTNFYKPGYRNACIFESSRIHFLDQIEIELANSKQLQEVVNHIQEIDLEIGGLRISHIWGDYLILKFELLSKTQGETCRLPIFEEFCQPSHPHSIGWHPYHRLRITIEWKPDDYDLVTGQPIRKFSKLSPKIQFRGKHYSETGRKSISPPGSEGTYLFRTGKFDFPVPSDPSRQLYPKTFSYRFLTNWCFTGFDVITNLTTKIRLNFHSAITHLLFWVHDNDYNGTKDGQFIDVIDKVILQLNNQDFLEASNWLLTQAIPEQIGLPTIEQTYYLLSLNRINPILGDIQIEQFQPFLDLNQIKTITLVVILKKNLPQPIDYRLGINAYEHNVFGYDTPACHTGPGLMFA